MPCYNTWIKSNLKFMKGFYLNLEKETLANEDYRRVLYTAKYSQLVLMSLLPGEEIGMEVHEDHDQFFRFESGEGKVFIDENIYDVSDGFTAIVPAGAKHNVVNSSKNKKLKLYTIYSPAEHKNGVIVHQKSEAVEEHFDGITSEK